MSELFNLLVQWGPPAGLLLIVLYGAYKLIMHVLDEFKRRDQEARAESIRREERLAGIIDKQGTSLEKLADTYEAGRRDHKDILEVLRR